MAPRITQAIIALSGVLTGVIAIAAFSYLGQPNETNEDNTSNTHTAQSTDISNTRLTRLRRSRPNRRRRNRNIPDSSENSSNLVEAEEEVDNRKMLSLFKEWSDDDNRNLLNLLHAISENQSRKGGITCNKCNMSPIRGVRYKCANCVDFDLCEMCEGSNTHINTHIFLKIRIPIPPLANPRSALLPAFYPGKYHNKPPLSTEKYRELQHKSHFDQIELEALYEQFKSLSTVDRDEGGIDRETFEQCLGPLGLEKSLITERIFAFFDQDDDGIISFPEIVAGLSVLCKGNLDEKIEYAFRGYDLDGDGYISRDELYRMYKSYFYLSMELVRDVVSAMEDEMMDTFEFSASQPVSAAFNVAMPSTASSDRNNENEETNSETSANDDVAGDGSTQWNLQDDETTSDQSNLPGPSNKSKSKKRKYPLKEDHFFRQYAIEAEQAKALSHVSEEQMRDMTDNVLRSDSQRFDIPKSLKSDNDYFMQPAMNQEQQRQLGKKAWKEKFPIMQTMSQGAIHEMVDKTFKSIKTERDGYINFEEFKECVQIDSSIVSWFEALGTVF
ncbi:Calcium-binding protein NCSA [Choanephora cucurbitarum]|uniref:Calcium-binding protein NCSA n=1 Tax=Choanephora cucurbitarum TaxID=101091 RepID=A0A1C7N5S3_9FUNG|nr:Calcium-binding protein NCSA [Choanephora cucurbitarum]